MKTDKVLGITAGVVLALTIATVIAFHSYGWIETSLSVELAVSATVVALWIKIICQGIAAKSLEFHKQGYDLCIMTLTTALTAIAAESAAAYNRGQMDRPEMVKVGLIVAIFVASMLLTLVTAYNSRVFEDAKIQAAKNSANPPKESYRSLFSFLAGMAIFVFNIYVIAKRSGG